MLVRDGDRPDRGFTRRTSRACPLTEAGGAREGYRGGEVITAPQGRRQWRAPVSTPSDPNDPRAAQPGTPGPGAGQQPPYGQPAPPPGQGQYGQPPYGQGQYGQGQYGQPQYAGAPGYGTTTAPSNGLGVAALVLGILALLGSWAPFVNILCIVLGIIGIVLGVMARARVRRGEATNGGMALTGIILSAIAVVVSLIVTVAVTAFIGSNFEGLQDCADPSLTQQEQQACIEDQLGGD
jgi:hypothetical protein